MIDLHFGNEITGGIAFVGNGMKSSVVSVSSGSFYHNGYDCWVEAIKIELKMVSEVTGNSIEYVSATFVEKCPEWEKAKYLLEANFEEEYIKFVHSLMNPDHIKIAIDKALEIGIEEGIVRKQKEILNVLGLNINFV